MSLFHKVKIKEVIRETPDTVTIVFDIPPEVKNQFTYNSGQYVTLSLNVNGKEERRAYSFSSSPYVDDYPAVTVKKVPDGLVSPMVNDEFRAGDNVWLMPPMGKFTTDIKESNRKHYMLYGGGSGVTPVMSIMKSVLTVEPQSVVTLIYVNRDEASIIFRNKLDALRKQYGERLNIHYGLDEAPAGWPGHSGRMSANDYAEATKRFEKEGYETEYFICGPSGMMEQVKKGLESLGVSEGKVHTEYFAAPASGKPVPAPAVEPEVQEESGQHSATVLYNGKEFNIVIAKGQTVLEAAKDQDVDPPYACQMGVCTTCRAKILEGEVKMDEREGLSDAEIAEGYILTCQSHPITRNIRIIYE